MSAAGDHIELMVVWYGCLLCRMGFVTQHLDSREIVVEVFQYSPNETRDELRLCQVGEIEVGLVAFLYAQEVLLRETSHRVHDGGIGDAPALGAQATLVQDLEDVAYRRARALRTRPDEFHDLGLQIAEDLADARSIRSKHADIGFRSHYSAPLLARHLSRCSSPTTGWCTN